MTAGLSDLLEPLWLARVAGLFQPGSEGAAPDSALMMVPLFETVDDLRRGGDLDAAAVRPAFGYRQTARSLAGRPAGDAGATRTATKMAGSSPPTRSCTAHKRSLADVCAEADVELFLFHGRGRCGGTGRRPHHPSGARPTPELAAWTAATHGAGGGRVLPLRPPAHRASPPGADDLRSPRSQPSARRAGASRRSGSTPLRSWPPRRAKPTGHSSIWTRGSCGTSSRRRPSMSSSAWRSARVRPSVAPRAASRTSAPFLGSFRGCRAATDCPDGTGSAARCSAWLDGEGRDAAQLVAMYDEWPFFR